MRPQLRDGGGLHRLRQSAEGAACLPHLIKLLHLGAGVSHLGFGGGQLGIDLVQLLLGHHFGARADQTVGAAKCLNVIFRFLNRLPQVFQPRIYRVRRFFIETRFGIRKAFEIGIRHAIGDLNGFFRRLRTRRHINDEGAIHPLGGGAQTQCAKRG